MTTDTPPTEDQQAQAYQDLRIAARDMRRTATQLDRSNCPALADRARTMATELEHTAQDLCPRADRHWQVADHRECLLCGYSHG